MLNCIALLCNVVSGETCGFSYKFYLDNLSSSYNKIIEYAQH
jgi:hypothetical protein